MKQPPTVHIDESGNSGQNLLDPNQPVFALAAVELADDDAERIAATLRGDSDEAHYTKMRRSGGGRSLALTALPTRHSRRTWSA